MLEKSVSATSGFERPCSFLCSLLLSRARSSSISFLSLSQSMDRAKVRLAFGLYIGKRLHGKMLSTPWTDIAPRAVKNGNTGKAETFSKLETRSTFPG